MRIARVRIRNFRGIRSLDLALGPVTVLIGENNSGKTSVLDALKLCLRDLSPRRRIVFSGMDFHLADGGRTFLGGPDRNRRDVLGQLRR